MNTFMLSSYFRHKFFLFDLVLNAILLGLGYGLRSHVVVVAIVTSLMTLYWYGVAVYAHRRHKEHKYLKAVFEENLNRMEEDECCRADCDNLSGYQNGNMAN